MKLLNVLKGDTDRQEKTEDITVNSCTKVQEAKKECLEFMPHTHGLKAAREYPQLPERENYGVLSKIDKITSSIKEIKLHIPSDTLSIIAYHDIHKVHADSIWYKLNINIWPYRVST